MPTGLSWTELRTGTEDVGALLAFRRSGLTVHSSRRLRLSVGLVVTLSAAAYVVPALLREPLHAEHVSELVVILPTMYLGFLVLTVFGAISSGGGREVVPREQAVAFPVTPVTEHLGALLLAPLNIAWLIQAWAILGTTGYVLGAGANPGRLAAAALPLLGWIATSTALGQAAGWWFEGVRRGPRGILVSRLITASVAIAVTGLVVSGRLTALLDNSPTVRIYLTAAHGQSGEWGRWTFEMAVLVALLVAAVLGGLVPARWALHRPLREELRLESGRRAPRPNPRSGLGAMIRLDRASIWRSVPLRRGLLVLALMPGAVALAGQLTWDLIVILPGLVASGGALLFGVNAWCLDGRGALWRDSLPVTPRVAFASKVIVLAEVLAISATATIVLAALRAGVPSAAQLAAVVTAVVVVVVQVVAASLRWSVLAPYAVDLRSARATPAPPVVMAGYSARLALRTTVVGLVFMGASASPDWQVPVLLGIPLLCWSAYRLLGTAAAWAQPEIRARVVAVVAS